MAKDTQNHEAPREALKAGGALSGQSRAPQNWRQFQEARLFSTGDRATLTFYLGQEVASIHFDKNRGEIFFRGHNVKNMTLNQEQWELLQQFGEYLKTHGAALELSQAYEASLAQFLPLR